MIYFVQPRGRPFVKIGYAGRSVEQRVCQLQTCSPEELIVIGTMWGGKANEAILHERFAHLHIRGEWFHLMDEIQSFIQAEATKFRPDLFDRKRIKVWVQRFKDRTNLMLQWIDPHTNQRKSKSAETSDPSLAEMRKTQMEHELNDRPS